MVWILGIFMIFTCLSKYFQSPDHVFLHRFCTYIKFLRHFPVFLPIHIAACKNLPCVIWNRVEQPFHLFHLLLCFQRVIVVGGALCQLELQLGVAPMALLMTQPVEALSLHVDEKPCLCGFPFDVGKMPPSVLVSRRHNVVALVFVVNILSGVEKQLRVIQSEYVVKFKLVFHRSLFSAAKLLNNDEKKVIFMQKYNFSPFFLQKT